MYLAFKFCFIDSCLDILIESFLSLHSNRRCHYCYSFQKREKEKFYFFLPSKNKKKSAELLKMFNSLGPSGPKVHNAYSSACRNNFFLTSTGYLTKSSVEIVSCSLYRFCQRVSPTYIMDYIKVQNLCSIKIID